MFRLRTPRGLAILNTTVMGRGGASAQPISAPSGFTDFGALPFTILRNPDGTIAIDPTFDLRTYSDIDNAAGVDKFVDPAGDNSDGLTWETAYQDFFWATSESNTRIIYCKAGFYNVYTGSGGWQGLGNYAKAIICVDEQPAVLCRSRVQSYSPSSSHYNSTSTVQIYGVYDLSRTNADGSYEALTLAADEAGVDAVAGTWFWGSNTLSVRTADDRAPDSDIVAVIGGENMSITATGARTAYFENLTFLFGSITGNGLVYLRGNGGLLKPYFYNCNFYQVATGPNVAVLGDCQPIFQNCVSKWAHTDGYNYHADGAQVPKGIEIDCLGYYAGYLSGTGSTFNGSSTHDAAPVVRINGDYGYSYGCPCADVGGAQSWNLGCESHHSLTPTAARNAGFLVGDGGANPTYMWLDTCHAHDNTYDLAPIEGEAMYTHLCTLDAGQNYDDGGGGTVTPY